MPATYMSTNEKCNFLGAVLLIPVHWEISRRQPACLISCCQKRDLDGILGFWLWPNSTPDIVCIWGWTSRRKTSHCLCIFLPAACLSIKVLTKISRTFFSYYIATLYCFTFFFFPGPQKMLFDVIKQVLLIL